MNKTFVFNYRENEDEEWETKYFPTKEEAEEEANDLENEMYEVSEIREIRQ